MPLDAQLHITTALRGERTIMKTSYCTQPFKIADITEDKGQGPLRMMLMSSSPGILDGDCYQMDITVGEGTHLALETQSFQRLFQMKRGASQTMTVTMEKRSSFCYLPHPVVPHQQAIFQSKTKIFLEERCCLLWGEVLCCGRKLNGEVFRFSSYHGLTEIYRNGKLIVKENLLMKPTETALSTIGQLEGYTHQATLLYLNEDAPVNTLIEELVSRLNEESSITFGVSALPVNGVVVRLLGNKAEQLFSLLKKIALLLQDAKEAVAIKMGAYVA